MSHPLDPHNDPAAYARWLADMAYSDRMDAEDALYDAGLDPDDFLSEPEPRPGVHEQRRAVARKAADTRKANNDDARLAAVLALIPQEGN